ncbi:DUF177 domain-containing protein [Acetobacteraceae bacterium ESL0709]|nr:DUF177 domain-containing protein [Acetobacteraceae bacterium ESL0697]MDF7678349.1 DUF177 domain-containing protein [Acetobacteraceae bacterium ESL0709]
MASKDTSSRSQDVKRTMEIEPEFSRRRSLLQINRGLEELLEATPSEREALARRFHLVEIRSLVCSFALVALPEDRVAAEGKLQADVVQRCVITNEPVDERVDEIFSLRFVPRREMIPDEALDIEALLAADYDEVPYDGHVIDLGEAAAEQLALALDPYPRKAGEGLDNFVEVVPEEDKIPSEEVKTPFSVLSQLKDIGKKG